MAAPSSDAFPSVIVRSFLPIAVGIQGGFAPCKVPGGLWLPGGALFLV